MNGSGPALIANAFFLVPGGRGFIPSDASSLKTTFSVETLVGFNEKVANLKRLDDIHNEKTPNGIDDSESGWEFWSKVYGTPQLHAQLQDRIQNGPTVSELLNSEKLCRAQLKFLNVPRIGAGSQQIIKSLIQSECGKQIGIFDVVITNRRWSVRFFRYEDAVHVFKVFDGYRFRNRFLSVRFENSGNQSIEVIERPVKISSETGIDNQILEIVEEGNGDTNKTWSKKEQADLDEFKSELIALVDSTPKNFPDITLDDSKLVTLKSRAAGVVKTALSLWPVGLLRLFAPQDYPRIYKNEWEPMAPSLIRTQYHLVEYVSALLQQFGPQQFSVDIPWRILISSLPSAFTSTEDAKTLMDMLPTFSSRFAVFDGAIFLITDVRHQRALAQYAESLPT